MLVLSGEMIVLNAFYAKEQGIIENKDINKYTNILINKLCNNNYLFIIRSETNTCSSLKTYEGIRFVMMQDNILLMDKISKEKIDEINSWYGDDIAKLIVEAREEYKKVDIANPLARKRE